MMKSDLELQTLTPAFDAHRREALILLGAGGLGLLAGSAGAQSTSSAGAKPQCVLSPQQTEGPYFSDLKLLRSDLRTEPGSNVLIPGVPLALTLRISAVGPGSCAPLANALVDLWHCDAQGVYSDVSSWAGANTRGKVFLRGNQITDAAGLVRFTTIYPGWYRGRAVHMHMKVRAKTAAGVPVEFTSQLYFDDALSDRIYEQKPYAGRRARTDRNDEDHIYRRGGPQMTLAVVPVASSAGSGLAATHDIGVQIA